MKVAIFTDNDFDKINGVTTTLSAVLRYAPADIQPRIYTASGLASDAPDYLALRSFGVSIPFYREMKMYVPHYRQYLERVKRDGIDVLHLTTPGPLGLVALWVASQTGLPLVGSFHTDLSAYTALLSGSEHLGALMREYMRWMYGRCARVLVPSDDTRELLSHARTSADRLRVWTRGVDTELFTPDKRSAQLRRDWGVSEHRPALLYVGRVSKEKGLALLPHLQDVLRSRRFPHQLVVVGEGPMQRELVDACPDAVFTGPLGRDAVAQAFASADVFVFPSETDTAGNVVLEAQSAGVPVIVSSRGGPRENLWSGLSGTVCEDQDPVRWANAVIGVCGSPAARDAMSLSARAYAQTRRWESALEPLFQTYRELCGRSATRAA